MEILTSVAFGDASVFRLRRILFVHNRCDARGEILMIEDRTGVRINEINNPEHK